MSLLDDAEKVVGAVVAVEAAKKINPEANILEEAAAAVAGYKGTGLVKDAIEKKEDEPQS